MKHRISQHDDEEKALRALVDDFADAMYQRLLFKKYEHQRSGWSATNDPSWDESEICRRICAHASKRIEYVHFEDIANYAAFAWNMRKSPLEVRDGIS